MPIYEIKSFSGISDFENKGAPGSFKFGANLKTRKFVDSLTCGQALIDEGLHSSRSSSASVSPSSSISLSPSPSSSLSISPTPSPSASASPSVSVSRSPSTTVSTSVSPSPSPSGSITTIFRDLVRFWVNCSDGYIYGFGSTGYIYRGDSDGFWQIVYKDADGQIKGAAEKPSDSGVISLYWANDRILKKKPIPGLSNWNDVTTVATNLTSADWHTMKQVDGGLHTANGPFLALVGYDDSYTNEALDLVPGNLAKTIVERSGRSIIGTTRASNPSRGINAAIDTEVPLIQVGDDGELFYANMADSVPTKRFPGGGKVNPSGVVNEVEQVQVFEWESTALSWIDKQEIGNLALFAVYGADAGRGGIYSYGRNNKNKSLTMNLDYQLDADELGAITTRNGYPLVSYQDGSDFGAKYVDLNNKAEAIYEGLDFNSPIKKSVEITSWNTAEIMCKSLPAGTWIEFWYRIDKNGEFLPATMEGGSTQFQLTGETRAVFNIGAQGDIFEPRIVLHPNGNVSPEVFRLRVFFT